MLKRYPKPALANIISGKIKKNKNFVQRCNSVELKFTKKQLKIVRKLFDVSRWGYNYAVNLTRQDSKISFYSLRKEVRQNLTLRQKKFMKNSHGHIFDESIHDVVKAYKTAKTHVKLGLIKRFRLRYKKSRSPIETICIPSECFSKKYNTFLPKKLGKDIKSQISIKGFKTTCRLSWNKHSNKFVLFMPVMKKMYSVKNRDRICSLDPGIRTFQTLYSKTKVHEFGKGINKKISYQLNRIESIKKQLKEGKATKLQFNKFTHRVYTKIKNYVKDFHWKTSLKLVRSYRTILVGNMSTQGICRGNLNKSSKRVAMMLSHYQFNRKLIDKAEQYGSKVIIVDESYTSKTCGGCFEKNYELGSSKIFCCNKCNFIWDRDFNGARNIMLRYYNVI